MEILGRGHLTKNKPDDFTRHVKIEDDEALLLHQQMKVNAEEIHALQERIEQIEARNVQLAVQTFKRLEALYPEMRTERTIVGNLLCVGDDVYYAVMDAD